MGFNCKEGWWVTINLGGEAVKAELDACHLVQKQWVYVQ